LNEFALRWDDIESRLQNPEFWYFLYRGKKNLETRIDLLFDNQVDKPKGLDDAFYAYRHYDKWYRDAVNLPGKWQEIIKIFQMLVDWFSDIRLYHLIGFLVNAEFLELPDILKTSEHSASKASFKEGLDQVIKDEMKAPGRGGEGPPYALKNLKYYKPNYERTRRVLLLFNIFSYEALLPGMRFPFWRYKEEDWSLEHIHPQNPEGLKDIEEIREWLLEQGRILKGDPLIKEVETLQKQAGSIVGEKIPQPFREKLKELGEQLVELLDLHGIGNLALLDKKTNSSIGNKPFLLKRRQILEKSAESNTFIPLATRNVFVKYYTKDIQDIQMHFWSSIDADDYEEAIEDRLKDYLPITSSEP
jgi:hypothetical protein